MHLLVVGFHLQQISQGHFVAAEAHAVVPVELLGWHGLQEGDEFAVGVLHQREQFSEIVAAVLGDQAGVVGLPIVVIVGVEAGHLAGEELCGGLPVGNVPTGQVGQQVFHRPDAQEDLVPFGRGQGGRGVEDLAARVQEVGDDLVFPDLGLAAHLDRFNAASAMPG